MAAYRDFQDILVKLESDRIKERSEGVARCRAFIGSNRNLNALRNDQRHAWIQTLQTLFSVVIKERNASVQKKAAATDKRLEEATQLVRYVVERIHRTVNRKTAKAIVTHLTQMTAISGKLQPYALNYMKALRTVLGFAPHLEHLDERAWTDIVMLAFSAVLGDSIRIGQAFADDTAMDIDEDVDTGPIGALRATEDEEVRLPKAVKKTATATEIELLGVVEIVFRSRSSPFLTYAQAIFRKFLRFFRLFPVETSAHLSAVTALNRAFAEIDLNDQRSMKRIGRHLWPHILALWSTKNALLKEQVIMALRYLFPFVVPARAHAKHESERDVVLRAKELFDAVLSEPTIRWREAFDLDIDHLALGIESTKRERPFSAQTFRIGVDFDEKDAVAWSVAELGADALARIYEAEDALSGNAAATNDTLSPVQRGKRRRLEDPLSSLLDSVTDPTVPANVLASHIQILDFLVDKHWTELSTEAQTRISDVLLPFLTATDAAVQRWACLLASSVAHLASDEVTHVEPNGTPARRARQSSGGSRWDQIWQLALRKLSSSELARTAANLANTLLAHDRVSPAVLSDSIEGFVKDLDVQTLSFPSEAVCLFFEWVLAIGASDARLVHLHVPDKVIAWLTTGWSPLDGIHRSHSFGQHRPYADPISTTGLVSLISRLAGLTVPERAGEPVLVPDCPIATMAIELSETSRIRDYLDAKVPAFHRDGQAKTPSLSTPADYDATCGAPEDLGHKTPRKISAWLFKTVSNLRGAAIAETHWTAMPADLVRRHLDLACVALAVEGVFAVHNVPPNRRLTREAADLVSTISPVLTLSRWTQRDRARLLKSLSPILVRGFDSMPPVEYPVLLDPGIASDLPPGLITRNAPPFANTRPVDEYTMMLVTMWKNDETRCMLDELLAAARCLLTDNADGRQSPEDGDSHAQSTQASQRIKELEQTQKADDFEEIKVGSGRSTEGREADATFSLRASEAVIGSCVDLEISAEMASNASPEAVRLREVLEAIVAAKEGENAIAIAEAAFAAVRNGFVSIGLAQAEAVLEHIGGELLPNYRHARNERFARVVLQFLERTAPLWVTVEPAREDFASRVRCVITWVIDLLRKKTLTAWRVRLQFTAFLDYYLKCDPSQRSWDLHGSAPRSADGRMITPTTIIPFMLTDADFRVRFLATSSAAKMFELCAVLGLPEDTLFNDIRDNVALNVSETELMLTQILCNANMVIAAGSRRRAPYQLLVRLSRESELAEVAIATLKGVTERLGFPSLRELYLYYARYFTWSDVRTAETDPDADLAHRLPYRACGFETLRDARAADYKQTASWLLQYKEANEAFVTLCEVVGRSPQDVRLDCFAQTAALTIAMHHNAGEVLVNSLSALAYGAGAHDIYQQDQLFDSALDETTAEILSLVWSNEWPAGAPGFLASDTNASRTFEQLVRVQERISTRSEPPPPHFPPDTIVQAVRWLESQRQVFRVPAILYCVVQRVLTAVETALFVSERERRLFSLALALSLGHRCAHDAATLALILDGLTNLLGRGDCVRFIAPMLEWALRAALELVEKTNPESALPRRLCEQLFRAAEACESLSALRLDECDLDATQGLYSSLETAVQRLTDSGGAAIAETLLVWPRSAFAVETCRPEDVRDALASTSALASTCTPARKFAIATRLIAHPKYRDLMARPDRARLVWDLMQAVPPSDTRQQDCLAFAQILYDGSGQYRSPAVGDAECSRVEEASTGGSLDIDGAKKLLVRQIFGYIRHPDRLLADRAFNVARCVFSLEGAPKFTGGSTDALLDSEIAGKLAWPALRRADRLRRAPERSLTEVESLAWLRLSEDADAWAQQFATLLADVLAAQDQIFGQLAPILSHSSAFAKEALPTLCYAVLLLGARDSQEEPTSALSAYFTRVLDSAPTATETMSLLVDTIMHLRRYARPDIRPAQPSRFDTWLSVPWLLVAKAASRTGKHLATLLSLELAHEYDRLFAVNAHGHPFSRPSDDTAQQLLYAVYESIDEVDGFYGRETPDVRDALLRRYRHENNWDGALRTYGARHEAITSQISGIDRTATGGVVQALASFGFRRLALDVWQPARLGDKVGEEDVPASLPYDLAWRTDVWDIPVDRAATPSSSAALYNALKAVRTARSVDTARPVAVDALVRETSKLSRVTLESPTPPPGTLSTILALREVLQVGTATEAESYLSKLTSLPPQISFENAEKILSTRCSILRGVRAREMVEQVGDEFTTDLYKRATAAEASCLIELSRLGRQSGRLQVSLNAITAANALVEGKDSLMVDQELAEVLWAQEEHKTAITLLSSVQDRSSQKAASTYARLGEWTANARLHGAKDILQRYFEPAVRALDRTAKPRERGRVHAAFAKFADEQYEDLRDIARDRNTRFVAYERRKTLELREMERRMQDGSLESGDLKRSRRQAEEHVQDDRRQLEEAQQLARDMLWRALQNYALCLTAVDSHDDRIYRFCALWLSCADDDEMQNNLKQILTEIPSHKFVFLAYQLSARLTKSSKPTSAAINIRSLVFRLCAQHPFHTLYPVHSLRSADTPATSTGRSSRRSSTSRESSVGFGTNNSRAQAASEIFEKARRDDRLRPRIEAVELVCVASAEWAAFDLKAHLPYLANPSSESRSLKKGPLPIVKNLKIKSQVRDLPIPVTTYHLAVDPTGRYEDGSFPSIVSYDDYFETAGGIHLPKIVVCRGSDGVAYKQLFKGDDDIRQDAVMEQAFDLVNSLLAKDEGGRRRKLRIRTYKVIPLQNRNGLLEFVRDTVPLGSILQNLYDKMAPNAQRKARDSLRLIETKYKSSYDRQVPLKDEQFRRILQETPPLFRHHFWLKHKVPALWFDMRLNYSRSVATTSIIGHVVGLGDRHVSNILMDEARGELVHIDLGIAFDQGKRLPIPELVPFRLTQNIIDGFGMTGVDGVFRRCCEETLRVLRERSSVIMTILEVFKHDPLQNWAVSAEMAKRIQGSTDVDAEALDELPDDADRALAIIRGKLDNRLSVEYTVNKLIQEATDPTHLARIFSGWQPYF